MHGAVQGRYGDQDLNGDQPAITVEQASKPGGKRGVEWQFIGADKVHARLSQLQSLEKATLINCCISQVVSVQHQLEHNVQCMQSQSVSPTG